MDFLSQDSLQSQVWMKRALQVRVIVLADVYYNTPN